jgi:AmiR/NasT family two-component response regulator
MRIFNARQVTLPVTVITAHDEPGAAERVLAPGVSAYLKKAADRGALLAVIAAARSSPTT